MSLVDRIKKLRIGKSIKVTSESERTQALNAANILGKRIITRKSKSGFTITRTPDL